MMGAIRETWILSPAWWKHNAAWKSMFGETEKGNGRFSEISVDTGWACFLEADTQKSQIKILHLCLFQEFLIKGA